MADTRLIRKTSVSKFYRAWVNMKSRCGNLKIKEYKLYGGRGIKVCKKWNTFDGFIEDMLSTYKDDLTLDRIDNSGNYCKNNCRWTTKKIQANNTRNIERAAKYPFQGLTLTVKQWAEKIGIKRTTLDMRLRQYKMPIEKALNKEVAYGR